QHRSGDWATVLYRRRAARGVWLAANEYWAVVTCRRDSRLRHRHRGHVLESSVQRCVDRVSVVKSLSVRIGGILLMASAIGALAPAAHAQNASEQAAKRRVFFGEL